MFVFIIITGKLPLADPSQMYASKTGCKEFSAIVVTYHLCALGLIDVSMRQVLAVVARLQSSRGCQVVAGSRRAPGVGRRRAGVKAGTAPALGRARVGAGTAPVLGRVVAAAGRRVAAAWASSEAVEPFRAVPSVAGLFPWGTPVAHRSREVVSALRRQLQHRDQLS